MSQQVHVHMLPRLIEPGSLEEGVAVVIDVLRASTTIVHALANGATSVVPCASVEEARQVGKRLSVDEQVLLGGERHCEPIDGFDLGNSPFDYTSEVVADKTVVFTTTNGTQALRHCEAANRVLIGTFVNRAALAGVLRDDGRPVHLVCAGTDGQLTAEDILFAGAVAADLNSTDFTPAVPDVQTQMAIDYYLARSTDEATFHETIRTSRGGQNLLRLGMDTDVNRASELDRFTIVPEWSRISNTITASE